MVLQKLVEAGKFSTVEIAVATHGGVRALVKALLLPHERIRIFFVFLPHSRMVGQELLQSGMVSDERLVIYQRWILAQPFSNLRVAVQEAVHVCQFAPRQVPITSLIFAPVKALLLVHEGARIFLVFLADARVLSQKLLQRGMVSDERLVIYQRWILAQLFSNLRVAVQEAVHVCQFAPRQVPITSLIFAPVKALLLVREGVRIFLVFLPDARVLSQKLLQRRMASDERLVIYQRWILAQLFSNLRVAVQEAVHVCQFAPRQVPITSLIFAPVKALLLVHEGARIFLVFLADARVLGQELLQSGMVSDERLVIY